jgi:long-chain acyl-CoA synthetase
LIRPETYVSLGELLCDALVQFKTETALVELDRKVEKHRWSYLDVRREVAKASAWLAKAGVGAGDHVGIVMSNQSRWLVAALAIFHRGAVLVPIDYKLSESEQRALLTHAGAKALFTEAFYHRRFKERPVAGPVLVEGPAADVKGADVKGEATPWDALEEAPPLGPPAPRRREDVACLVYSSGTGGRPKGCLLPHGAYLAQLGALMELYPLRPGHTFFSVLPTNHAIDFMVGFVGPLSCGATVVHQRTLRPEFLLPTMQSERVTHMALVPAMLAGIVRAIDERIEKRPRWQQGAVSLLGAVNEIVTRGAPNAERSRRLLPAIHDALGGHLELLFCGGAFVDRARAEKLYRWGIPVAIGYGLTECCTVATVNDLRPFRADSVGRAVTGVTIRIDRPDPRTGVGEVQISGPTLMRGYHQDPELTAETIVDGWLRTGDLGWLDASGHLHLVGRAKNMIVTAGGKNVYPEDVEGALEGLSVPGATVAELAVFASGYVWPGARALVDEELVAVVRLEGGDAGETLAQQIAQKNRRLPEHKRVGGLLVTGVAFPRTASLKVKRHELKELLAAAHPIDDVRKVDVGAKSEVPS